MLAFFSTKTQGRAFAEVLGYDANFAKPAAKSSPFALNSSELLFSKRDDFAQGSRGRQNFGIEYAKLDPFDLSIDAEERFLRVASAYRFADSESNDWISKWIMERKPPLFNSIGKVFAQEIFDFAYEARFGLEQSPAMVTQLIKQFDAAFKQDHCGANLETGFKACHSSLAEIDPVKLAEPFRARGIIPSSLHYSYLSALADAERHLTRTQKIGSWTTISRGGYTRVTWPPPVETEYWN